jgi:mannose-6-phosphate isomerase-like protein (cupin superfamily)
VDLGRLAGIHRQSPRPYLEALRTGGLSAGLYRVPRGGGGDQPPHGEEKVYLVLEGRGRFRMGDEEFALEPGQLFTVPARVEHGFHSIAEDLLLLAIFAPPEGTVAQAPA